MQWFADRSVSEEIAQALADRQDLVHRSPDDSLTPPDVLDFAYAKQWDVITADPAVARAAVAGKSRFNRSIVLLKSAEDVERLFGRYKRLTPGRLYTVTASRVKLRQLSRLCGGGNPIKLPRRVRPRLHPKRTSFEEKEI